MAARYRDNVSSKHYVHVRRKGCTGSTRGGSREGAGGEKYRKNVHPSSFKMQSPCNTTCRYKGCNEEDHIDHAWPSSTQEPAVLQPDSPDAFHLAAAEKHSALPRENKRDVTKLRSVLQTFAKLHRCARCLSWRAESENLYTADWTGARNNWPQQLRKLIAEIKIKKGDGLALL